MRYLQVLRINKYIKWPDSCYALYLVDSFYNLPHLQRPLKCQYFHCHTLNLSFYPSIHPLWHFRSFQNIVVVWHTIISPSISFINFLLYRIMGFFPLDHRSSCHIYCTWLYYWTLRPRSNLFINHPVLSWGNFLLALLISLASIQTLAADCPEASD